MQPNFYCFFFLGMNVMVIAFVLKQAPKSWKGCWRNWKSEQNYINNINHRILKIGLNTQKSPEIWRYWLSLRFREEKEQIKTSKKWNKKDKETYLHRIQPCQQVKVIFRYLRPDAPVLLFFHLFTQVHLLIDGSIDGQYVT